MNYITKLFSTGAVRKTPKKVIAKMIQAIQGRPAEVVVEIGAGRGELTKAILDSAKRNTSYLAFEIDEKACAYLQQTFPRISVIQESAFTFPGHLPQGKQMGLFVSSIPLSFYPEKKLNTLLDEVKNNLQNGGTAVIVFSAFWLIPALRKKLPGARIHSFVTFPLYFMLVYKAA